MATYPDDATAPTTTAFSALTEQTFSNTGASRTDFNLTNKVNNKAEVVAFIDGVEQATSSYDLSNSFFTVSFTSAPNASNLTIKTVSVPARFLVTRSLPAIRAVDYSNTSITTVNSNTYLINSETTTFSLPEGTQNISSATDFMVYLSGVFQSSAGFTYPSAVLSTDGIDIADNAATKLLTNFTNNITDDSGNHTLVKFGGTSVFSGSNISLDGTDDFLYIPSSNDFEIHDKNYTLDLFFKPDTGASMSSNQSLFVNHFDADENYNLRLVGANSNVGFVVNNKGSITEMYGGNANGGSNYHVAVSYDINTQNLNLYVNNVKVAHKSYVSGQAIAGNVTIGANSNLASKGEFYNGNIEFVRHAHSARYRTPQIAAVSDFTPDVTTGSPLGAIDSSDTLSIRVFDGTVDTQDRFSSMADRKPDKGFTSEKKFDTITFTSQSGYEKRRLKSRRPKRAYNLKYTNITGVEKTAIENFYNARSGEFESFTFDLSHINESGSINARFDGSLQIAQVLSHGTALTDNFYTVNFKLQETYD